MNPQNASSNPDKMIDAISSFLNAPPDGTPAEIIEAFAAIGDKDFLPPRLFLETVKQAPIAISITAGRGLRRRYRLPREVPGRSRTCGHVL